jgi:putative nucleotidyltransferase with HDIG domain
MIKILLNIILILLTFFACYFEDTYFLFWSPQPHITTPIAIRAQTAFIYDQEKALSAKRKKALANYIPVFSFIPQRIETSKNKLSSLKAELALHKAVKGDGASNLAAFIKTQFGVKLSRPDVIQLIKYRDLDNLLDGIVTIQDSTLQDKILETDLYLKGKKTIEVHNPVSNETAMYAVENISTLEQARLSMQTKIRQLFWQVDHRILDPLIQISISTLLPNLTYNPKENEKRLAKLDRQFPSQTIEYKPSDILVPSGKFLSEDDVRLLSRYQHQTNQHAFQDAVWVLFSIVFLVIFFNLFISRIAADISNRIPPRHILLSMLILHIIILKACLLFTPFPIYALPFSLLSLMVVSLNHGRIIAIVTTIVAALMVSLFCGQPFEMALYFIFGGLTAVLIASRIQKRVLIFIPILFVGFVNATSVMAFTLEWPMTISKIASLPNINLKALVNLLNPALIESIGWAFVGGVVAGPLALILLPILEVSQQTASTFKLSRFTDLQRPIMKKLLNEARGTYQHSMTVAYLAQAAGEAIGANTLLLRIGAYYHDIGKMANPGYFIENQFNGENPHDILKPEESANLIVDHVRNGMKFGQESGLPRVVIDLIVQHHGTHLIEYFYNLATKSNPKRSIPEDDFRYPGPKPQSNEAAILMIADAVEAASRSLNEPNRKNFENMIRHVLVERILDGQFSQCELTTHDLEKVVLSLVDSLEAAFHSRVRYPWQQNAPQPVKGTWRIDKINDKDRKNRSFKL